MEDWSDDDAKKAEGQGWLLHRVWDMDRERFEYVIFKCDMSNIFLTDDAARVFVGGQAKRGDALAKKATGIIFRSRVGQPRSRSRNKERA